MPRNQGDVQLKKEGEKKKAKSIVTWHEIESDGSVKSSNCFLCSEPSHSIMCHVTVDSAFFFSPSLFNWTSLWLWNISTQCKN